MMKTKIIKLKSVDSTNEYCKRLNTQNDVIVTSKVQTAGKGTKGRSFISDSGGLYISVMRTMENFDEKNVFSIMVSCCVAVCKTVEYFGVKPTVRWANDVLVGGKKICGTLIENTLSSGHMCRSIVGMGINVNNSLPAELQPIATSLIKESGRKISVNKVRKKLLENLKRQYALKDYKAYIDWLGNTVTLITGGKTLSAKAIDIADDGRLVCEIDGEIKKISSAEVSLRL